LQPTLLLVDIFVVGRFLWMFLVGRFLCMQTLFITREDVATDVKSSFGG